MSRVYARTNDAGSGRRFARTVDTGVVTPIITALSKMSPQNGDSVTATVVNAGASQGAGSLKIGGVAQTITSWADTSIVFTFVRGVNKYGPGASAVLQRNDLSSSAAFALTSIAPPTGWSFVDIGTPHPTAAYRITAVADAVAGDQIAYNNVGGLVAVAADLTFQADVSVTTFDATLWHTGDGWGAVGAQTFSPQYSAITFTFPIDADGGAPYLGISVDWFLASSWGGIKVAGAITALNSLGNLVASVELPPGPYWIHYKLFGDDNFAASRPLVLA